MTSDIAQAENLSRIHLGSAPDSWGVWMADDARQTPWNRLLTEIAAAGCVWMELGPYGYLPTDRARLVAETYRRRAPGLMERGGRHWTRTSDLLHVKQVL